MVPMCDQDETGYLLRSPERGARLLAAIAWLERGEGYERELIFPEDDDD